ncbi:MAG: DivIVA domain-containing protein [Acidimicrobiales bacterium]
MDNSSSSHSILDTLRTVEFRLGLKGYNVDEVDEYLEKAAVEAEQVQERLRIADERLRDATERIAQLEAELASAPRPTGAREQSPAPSAPAGEPSGSVVTDDTLQRTLVLAQKFVEQTKRESEAEAAQVVGRAEERARALLAQAEERARQVTAQAEERLRDEVARLEGARARLASDVEAMSRHLEEQRTKIRASLVDALRWVDERLQGPVERGGEGRSSTPSAERKTSSDAPSAARGEPAGTAATAALSPVGSAVPRPLPGAAGASERQPTGVLQATSPSERTETPPRARVLNGDLFAAGRDLAARPEENHPGD